MTRLHAAAVRIFFALVVVAMAAAMQTSLMAQESFRATHYARIDGSQEVPPKATQGYGVAILRLDATARTVEYRISISGIPKDSILMAHFHGGAPGVIGSVVHPIDLGGTFATSFTVTGTWTGVTDEQIDSLDQGLIYINFHSTTHPEGEIRGVVERVPNARTIIMNGSLEVPPVTTTNGSGAAELYVDQAARRAEYKVSWTGLSGAPISAHFHLGALGVSGDPIHPIDVTGLGASDTVFGVWENISEAHMAALIQGGIYVNVHTAENTGGEIRGQMFAGDFYTAAISAANEVPPVTGSQAMGTGFVLIGHLPPIFGGSQMAGEFVVGGTTGPIRAAHIHSEPTGAVFRPLTFLGIDSTHFQLGPEVVTVDTVAIFTAGRMYANFHTAQHAGGEARGNLVAAANSWASLSSTRDAKDAASGMSLQARLADRSLEFIVKNERPASNARVVLYSSLGDRVGSADVTDHRVLFDGSTLSSGVYFAHLLVDGQPVATTSVVITR